MNRTFNRRHFLAGMGAAGAAGLFGLPMHARADKGEVVVANWGGSWNERTVKYVEAPYVESAGIKVVRDLTAAANRKTKLLAERKLPRATIDVAHASETDAYFLNTQEVWDTVDEKKVPNLKYVHDNLKTKYFVPWQYSGWVVLYNPARVSEPPRSFADLWNPKYAGKVGLTDVHYAWHQQAAALATGGGPLDIAAGQKHLLELKKMVQPRLYPSHEQIQVALKNEEVWLSCNFRARVLQFANDGVNVQPVYPKEGGIAVVFGAGVTKRARNKKNAYFYLNALLQPKGMAELAQASFYAPAVSNAPLSPEMKAKLEFAPDEQKRLHFPDLGKVGAADAGMLDWWNKVFKA